MGCGLYTMKDGTTWGYTNTDDNGEAVCGQGMCGFKKVYSTGGGASVE